MDKRTVYIVLGVLVILYLVSRKSDPDILQDLRTKAVAIWDGKSKNSEADATSTQWEKHRQEVFASHVEDSKRRAIGKYPTLAVPNSEMNIRFVFRYQWMVKEDNARLRSPDWPELLADDCASATHTIAKVAGAKSSPARGDTAALATR